MPRTTRSSAFVPTKMTTAIPFYVSDVIHGSISNATTILPNKCQKFTHAPIVNQGKSTREMRPCDRGERGNTWTLVIEDQRSRQPRVIRRRLRSRKLTLMAGPSTNMSTPPLSITPAGVLEINHLRPSARKLVIDPPAQ